MLINCLFIGDELLDGRVLNRNQQTISTLLWNAGYTINSTFSIGDAIDPLIHKMADINRQSQIVICTGGLGPTEDDRTMVALSQMAKVKWVRSAEIEVMLRSFYKQQDRRMPDSNLKQADIPQGARIIPNQTGTAVGIQLKVDGSWWFLLPGVPREMTSMVSHYIIPFLDRTIPHCKKQRKVTTFKCVGVGESVIADRLMRLYPLPTPIDIRYQVPFPEVHVQCCAEGTYDHRLKNQYSTVIADIADQLTDCCYTTTDDSFETVIVDHLKQKGKTISIAESCTGGRIAQMITSVPGSSLIFRCGIVAYSNESKIDLLGVNLEDIDDYGSVSCHVAEGMADGIRKRSGADIGLSVTGIAGPDGGTSEKSVGTVYVAISTEKGTTSERLNFLGQRDQIQIKVSYYVLYSLFR